MQRRRVWFSVWASLLTLVLSASNALGQQPPPPADPPTGDPSQAAAQTASDDDDLVLKLAQPDFVVVNLPTSMRLPRHGGNFRLTHRFLANLRSGSFTDNLGNLFGLDNGAIIALEARFAPIRKLQGIVFRNNLDKTFQFSAQYDPIQQGDRLPVSLSAIVSVEGTNNFRGSSGDGEHDHSDGATGHRSPAIGGVVSRLIGTRAAVYVTPMYVHHTLATDDGGHRNTAFVGLGARVRIGAKAYVVGEVSPRVAGYAPGDPEYAFGIERRAGGHMFQLTFTNSFAGTFGQIARGGFPSSIYLGFNLARKFF